MVQRSRKIELSQTVAVAVASLPCSFALISLIAVYAPMDPAERIFGSGLLLPLVWTAIAMLGFLASDARRALLLLGTSTLIASGLTALRVLGVL